MGDRGQFARNLDVLAQVVGGRLSGRLLLADEQGQWVAAVQVCEGGLIEPREQGVLARTLRAGMLGFHESGGCPQRGDRQSLFAFLHRALEGGDEDVDDEDTQDAPTAPDPGASTASALSDDLRGLLDEPVDPAFLEPDAPPSQARLLDQARAHLLAGRVHQARKALGRAEAARPGAPLVAVHLAVCELLEGRFEHASRSAMDAVGRAPYDGPVMQLAVALSQHVGTTVGR